VPSFTPFAVPSTLNLLQEININAENNNTTCFIVFFLNGYAEKFSLNFI
jgi:hypothetical protein